MCAMRNVLFVCSRNRLRSPTAEAVFSGRADLEVASAELNRGADVEVSPELVEWADVIFCMERRHQVKLRRNFRPHPKGKRVVRLDIPDEYDYMQPELVRLLEARVRHLLRL